MREFPVSDCTFSPSLCHIDLAAIRRNFGRMRALGASRSALIAMVLIRTTVSAGLGALVGGAIGVAMVGATTGGELPHWTFVVGVGMLALAMSLLGCAVPAVAAARQDPVAILRVPYTGFIGDIAVNDTQGDDAPDYTGWGSRWQLLFNPEA